MAPTVALFADGPAFRGINIAAQGTRSALEAAGINVIFRDLRAPDEWRESDRIDLNVIHANPDSLALRWSEPHRVRRWTGGRPTIGYWVWEAPGIPDFWKPWLPLVDALWVPSKFVAEAVSGQVGVPTAVVPHAIAPPPPALDRAQLGLPADAFIFLFVFNALSNLTRKNPLGLVRAYRTAFPRESPARVLILKTIGMTRRQMPIMADAIGGRRDIVIVNRPLHPAGLSSLIAACDCYVSLHRSEGFGLTLAEAMFFARPVICTGYSGVMDFVDRQTAYLVDYDLWALSGKHGVYEPGTVFAEPNAEQAAALMRHVLRNGEEARAMGQRAASSVASALSPAAVGARMSALIDAQLRASA